MRAQFRGGTDRGAGIDFHAHLAPQLSSGRLGGFDLVEKDGLYVIDGRAVGPRALYEPSSLVHYLETTRLSAALVSPSPPFFRQGLDAILCAQWVRALNYGIIKAAQADERLRPLVYLPLEHPTVALEEFMFFREDPSTIGWVASSGGRSVSMDSPELDDLWSGLDSASSWVFLHPGTSPDPRLNRLYLSNTIGNPFESALAVGELIFGDVLFKHPSIRFLIAHCGGAFPALIGRWQRAFDVGRPGATDCHIEPASAARHFYVDTVAHSFASMTLALSIVGRDRLVLGSDWPYPMGVGNPLEEISMLPRADSNRVLVENAHALIAINGNALNRFGTNK